MEILSVSLKSCSGCLRDNWCERKTVETCVYSFVIFRSHDPGLSHKRARPVLCPLNLVSYPALTNASLPFSCRECRSRNIFPNDGSTNGLWAILLRSNDRVCRKSSVQKYNISPRCPGELLARPSADASADPHWPMASGGPGIFLRTLGWKLLRIAGNSPGLQRADRLSTLEEGETLHCCCHGIKPF